MQYELETVNKLYLELSQFATAKTAIELEHEKQNAALRKLLDAHVPGWREMQEDAL